MNSAKQESILLPFLRPLSGPCLVLLFVFWGTLGCQHIGPVSGFPEPLKVQLAQHREWLTISYFKNRRALFPPAELVGTKAWIIQDEDGRAVSMREKMTSSFLGIMERMQGGEPFAARIDLDDDVDLHDLLPYREGVERVLFEGVRSEQYRFRSLSQGRFVLELDQSRGFVVFMPKPEAGAKVQRGDARQQAGLWYAPFGPESEIFGFLVKLMGKKGGRKQNAKARDLAGPYLHHDAMRSIEVAVDPSFPQQNFAAIAPALDSWSQVSGRQLVLAKQSRQPLDPAECLSAYRLCLRWSGPPHVSFAGMSGFTNISFNPSSGEIIGGIITLINTDKPTLHLPRDEAEKVRAGKVDLDYVAGKMLQHASMEKVLHPDAAAYLRYLLMHELGHYHGLAHNFYIDETTKPDQALPTVMGYPPFPIAHLTTDIGLADRQRLSLPRKKPGKVRLTPYCSTLEALAPDFVQGIARRPAQCDVFAIGDEVDWYLSLARQADGGVFATYPDESHLPGELRELYQEAREERGLPPKNLLTRLSVVLLRRGESAAQQKKVTDFLCAEPKLLHAIRTQLEKYANYRLRCL